MALVRDALLDRGNTGDNTPAFVDVVLAAGNRRDRARDAQGRRLGQREPHRDARAGRRLRGRASAWSLETVEAKATGACPPLLDRRRRRRDVRQGRRAGQARAAARDRLAFPRTTVSAALKRELLAAVNATGIGPAGLGGDTTALAVHW